jgi:hypothetical protein
MWLNHLGHKPPGNMEGHCCSNGANLPILRYPSFCFVHCITDWHAVSKEIFIKVTQFSSPTSVSIRHSVLPYISPFHIHSISHLFNFILHAQFSSSTISPSPPSYVSVQPGAVSKKYNRLLQRLNGRGSALPATAYRLDDRGVGARVPVGSRILTSPHHADWFWGPLNLLHWGKSCRSVKLTAHLQLVPRSRKRESIHPLPHTYSWRSA